MIQSELPQHPEFSKNGFRTVHGGYPKGKDPSPCPEQTVILFDGFTAYGIEYSIQTLFSNNFAHYFLKIGIPIVYRMLHAVRFQVLYFFRSTTGTENNTFFIQCHLYPVSYTHLRAHETDSSIVCR